MADLPNVPRRLDKVDAQWHGQMFFSSLITGVLGIAAIANGKLALGILLLLLIIAAGWLSRFWFIVDRLGGTPRLIVWAAAVPGGALYIAVMWAFKFIGDVLSRR